MRNREKKGPEPEELRPFEFSSAGGLPGGIFFPLLVLGSLVGNVFGQAAASALPSARQRRRDGALTGPVRTYQPAVPISAIGRLSPSQV